MSVINDPEFGKIIVRKYPSASSIKVRRAPNGDLRISAPTYAPNFVIKNFTYGAMAKQFICFLQRMM